MWFNFELWAKDEVGCDDARNQAAQWVRPRPPQEWCPDLKNAQLALGNVLEDLTEIATEQMKQTVLGEGAAEALIAEEMERVTLVCQQIKLDADKMNPKWNKAYGSGAGKTIWTGPLKDGRDRGSKPYFSPDGWCRFSLNVCPDSEFETKFKGWGYAYHGTAGKNVGPILASGFMGASYDNWRVYMSPSVEYCSHWRYAKPTWNPELRQFVQTVLQCRVNPTLIKKIQPETLCHARWGLTHHKDKPIDTNFKNSELEWLFDSEFRAGGKGFIKDAIVCTGIMIRLTDKDPNDCSFWWSGSQRRAGLAVIPGQVRSESLWPRASVKVMRPRIANLSVATLLSDDLKMDFDTVYQGDARIASSPFGEGGMRLAFHAHWQGKFFVVKRFNEICQDLLKHDYRETCHNGALRDIRCQLLGKALAEQFSLVLANAWPNLKGKGFLPKYVGPLLVQINGDEYVYAEEALEGTFEKYNSNNGWINPAKSLTGCLAASFCHWSLLQTGEKALLCDIQGVDTRWTDPQVHTTRVSRNDALFNRFGLGNHGEAGMTRFFTTHKCNRMCTKLGLQQPTTLKLKSRRPVRAADAAVPAGAISVRAPRRHQPEPCCGCFAFFR